MPAHSSIELNLPVSSWLATRLARHLEKSRGISSSARVSDTNKDMLFTHMLWDLERMLRRCAKVVGIHRAISLAYCCKYKISRRPEQGTATMILPRLSGGDCLRATFPHRVLIKRPQTCYRATFSPRS